MFNLYEQSFEPIAKLKAFFASHPRIAIGFSGGCDSAFLLCAAVQAHVDVSAYLARAQFQPEFECRDACLVAEQLGISIKMLDIDILADATIAQNPINRCYYCKKAIFGKILEQAQNDGYDVICDGTNASDDVSDRPGFAALQELGVLSPLRMAGFEKSLIRHLSTLAGLPTAAKPAYACLATRFPSGTLLTEDGLKRIERAENKLFEMGFSDFRVRCFHDAARIQFHSADWMRAMNMRTQIRSAFAELFDMIFFDTEVR